MMPVAVASGVYAWRYVRQVVACHRVGRTIGSGRPVTRELPGPKTRSHPPMRPGQTGFRAPPLSSMDRGDI